MLARLLRFLLLILGVMGIGLGYFLVQWTDAPLWNVVVLPVGLPLVAAAVLTLATALKSRAGNEDRALWWRSVWGEFLAGIRIFLLRQPWTVRTPVILPATATPTRIPVVLVHGYFCNHRIWDDVANHLRSQGHAVVMAVNLEPLFTSIDRYAPIVEAAVTAVCQHTGSSRVALVGHSMGGLAIRAWMRAHGTQRVARVLTLGTPHAGTQIEPRNCTPNGQQMVWQSAWLAELAATETQASRALIRIALTPQDNIVYPQRAQVLPGVEPTVFNGIGHLQMCLDPAVIVWVREQLAELHQGTIP